MLRRLLAINGSKVGRRRVRTLMQRMGIEALYRKPRTTKPEPGHKIYPYLLRGVEVTKPNQVWAMDITYIPMARGHCQNNCRTPTLAEERRTIMQHRTRATR
jgi:putative transposase